MAPARATQHLLDQGYRRIACVTGPSDRTTATDRLAGYTKAIREWGIALDEGLVRHADFKEAGGYEEAYALLTTTEPPDAFFVTNNQMTLGALAAIAALELNVPEDVGVVGFDDPAWAPLLRPPLTAIAQPAYEMGATAARLLEGRAAGDDQPPRLVVIRADLVVRGTSLRRAPEAQEARPNTVAF